MKFFHAIHLILITVAASSLFAQSPDSIRSLPPPKWTRTRTIDIKHIALDLRFNWKKKQVMGVALIKLSLFQAGDKVTLDAGNLTINSVTLPDGKMLKFEYDGGDKDDGLAITLDKIYHTSDEIALLIDYHTNWINDTDPNNIWGSYGKGVRFFNPTSGTPIRRKQIWSAGEPQSNRYWFPAYDAPNDVRTTEFRATVEKTFTVISNGNLIETKNNPDGTKTFYYKTDMPYPNYLTSFVVGEYVDVKHNAGDVALHTYCYPDEKAAAEATTERLPDMVNYFSKLLNTNFPYPQFTQVTAQDYPFPAGIGQQGFAIVSDNMIDDFRTHADFLYLWDGIESEGVLSQWFGNLISPRDWSDIWLSKSFVHYFDGLYTDFKNGHDEYLIWYNRVFEQPTIANDWNIGYRHPIVTKNYDDVNSFITDNHAKLQGALVLRMLRHELGEENWWKAIQHYVKSNANKQVSTEDFRLAIEEATGQSMEWFFDQWIYKMGRPSFEVKKKYDAVNKKLQVSLIQSQKLDLKNEYPQVKFFRGKMAIEIDSRIETVEIEAKEENNFTFSLNEEPKFVHIDYDNIWIKNSYFQKTKDEWLAQLNYSKDVLARWDAIDSLTKIAKSKGVTSADKQQIIQAFRKTVWGNAYWRLKNYALSQLRVLLDPPYDDETVQLLLYLVKNGEPWLRTSAITFLGMTKDAKYEHIYLNALNDQSDRVINAAATALGKCKSKKAYDALVNLKDRPSWKSQSLISALNGLKELGDQRGAKIALEALTNVTYPRWWLAVSTWDYPIPAAETLVALRQADKGYPIVWKRLKKAVEENDNADIFHNLLLVSILGDPRGQECFDLLKSKFKNDTNAMTAVNNYEAQYKNALTKK